MHYGAVESRCTLNKTHVLNENLAIHLCTHSGPIFFFSFYRQSFDDGAADDWQQNGDWRDVWVPVPQVHGQVGLFISTAKALISGHSREEKLSEIGAGRLRE